MARKNPKLKSQRHFKRKPPIRKPNDRILIVCEGSKTEPNYLEEIRQNLRLPQVNLKIIPSHLGTEPKKVVESAESVFLETREFDKIFVVFDRDDHLTYADAISMAMARDNRHKNDEKSRVRFEAIVSVPSFELWLLLHFSDIVAWLHRDEALRRLRGHLPSYQKGMADIFQKTVGNLANAIRRARHLKGMFSRLPGDDAYTDMHELVEFLLSLKK